MTNSEILARLDGLDGDALDEAIAQEEQALREESVREFFPDAVSPGEGSYEWLICDGSVRISSDLLIADCRDDEWPKSHRREVLRTIKAAFEAGKSSAD
ncbi:hypothetical protein H9Q09_12050 [Aurantimonas sp. DM33-3]|uniref:hypothetical protein n=1 Tax=Aurantimonas TaxID=182269 RepID=UPI00165269EF|nr:MULTISPECIES: hypothetical protein [Aurantimonas]MBC6716941.1 hypothetical protein [Aurantimonas sp. DM33-3]MCC4298413.1 hypothetical protein [Aurantimonas coralicida]